MSNTKYSGETADYELDNGRVYQLPVNHCVFCKRCTDIFYDYTNGPYMFFCELEKEPTITSNSCFREFFSHTGYKFDKEEYLQRMEQKYKQCQRLKTTLEETEFGKAFIEALEKQILYGKGEQK